VSNSGTTLGLDGGELDADLPLLGVVIDGLMCPLVSHLLIVFISPPHTIAQVKLMSHIRLHLSSLMPPRNLLRRASPAQSRPGPVFPALNEH
jgi:hypothetical protein